MQVSEIQLFQILKEKVGEEEAQTLTEYIEAKVGKQLDFKKEISPSRFNHSKNLELAQLRTEFYIEINKSKIETIKLLVFVVIILILISMILVGFSR